MHRQCYEYAKEGPRYGDLCDNIGLVGVSAKWSYVTASPSHHDKAVPILSPLHVGHRYIQWRDPGFARGGFPKNDTYAHNIGGRGPTHVKFDRTQNRPTRQRPLDSAQYVSLALELIPAYFYLLAFATVAGPFE